MLVFGGWFLSSGDIVPAIAYCLLGIWNLHLSGFCLKNRHQRR